MSDLNELLKLKAEKKLTTEIDKWLSDIRKHPFFSAIEHELLVDGRDTLRLAMWSSSESFGVKIKQKYLNKYVKTETQSFMDKVETMQNEIDELRDQMSQ